ncbi:hypothetical protein FKW77_005176 [Venturia effusa]|uniref:WW domain-containing protein n=1 Tax=Venturia effusa TaxID=50376 RepID=A0A517LCB5_9PEZI|nr:hypothetical protein FKW77_005176 [Venturia effusa]
MSRRSRYDEDLNRLPAGMKRVGYNSNSQKYTFQDQNDGTFWESPEGAEFGILAPIRADQVETDAPIEDLFAKTTMRKSSTLPAAMTVTDAPPATDFEDILKDVDHTSRYRKTSSATTLSNGSQKLSQKWKGALGFASATAKLITGSKKDSDEKPLLKEVERRIEERLRNEKGMKGTNANPWV